MCVLCLCVSSLGLILVWFGFTIGKTHTHMHTHTHVARLYDTPSSPLACRSSLRATSRSRRFGHRRPAELYTYVSLFSSTSERAPVLLLPTTRTSTSTTTPAAARTAPTAGHTADPQTAGQLAYLHDTGGAVGQNAALCAR